LKISVIMLTYNREQLVGRAVESILNQTFHDFELIIVDNGSTDRSGEICDRYAAKDRRVRVIHRARGNIGSGRNTGLNTAKGEYIAFIDDDDWVEPDYLEFLHNLAVENNADIAICGTSHKAYDEKLIMTTEESLIELLWRKRYNVGFPTKLFKASLFSELRFSEYSMYDDIELMPRVMGGAKKIAYHGLPKYNIERHGGNHSAWTTNHMLLDSATLDEYLSVYRARTKWLTENFPGSAEAWLYFEWSFMLSMVEKITRLRLRNCERQCCKMIKELRQHREEFLGCGLAQDFEWEWINRYIPEAIKV
jgi:glycosyltransferase involved in cell wall biosynthesis